MPTQLRLPLEIERHYDRGERGLTLVQRCQREWATEAVQSGLYWTDTRTEGLMRRLRAMHYDDALVCGLWRLELLYIGRGTPHFRLYWRGVVFGVVDIQAHLADIGSSRKMPVVRRMMAAFLVLCGWRETCITERPGKARTPLSANTDHQYRLFKTILPRKREDSYDVLRVERMMA